MDDMQKKVNHLCLLLRLQVIEYLLKVDRIEVASARVSKGESEAFRSICDWARSKGCLERVEVLGFVDDGVSVDWIASNGGKVINILAKGSLKHLTMQLRKSPQEHISDISRVVSYAASKGLSCNIYLEDWSHGMLDSQDYVFELMDGLKDLPDAYARLVSALEMLSYSSEEPFLSAATALADAEAEALPKYAKEVRAKHVSELKWYFEKMHRGGCLPLGWKLLREVYRDPSDPAPEKVTEKIELFNGKDLTNWYTFLRGRGRNVDPKGVFTVTNGNLVSYAFREPVSGLSVLFKRKVTLDECAVVGGGGGGGNTIGGGGGGGEVAFTNLVCMEAGQSLPITVGAGGAGNASNYGNGGAGSPSTLTVGGVELTALGGGGGSGYSKTLDSGTFASGGGSANSNYGTAGKQWTEGRGNHGGAGSDPYGGGGGGAGGPGVSGDKAKAISGDGGMGILTYVSGRKVVYGSGGGGGVRSDASIPGKGGPGAGDGSAWAGLNGTPGTGGGGGGGGFQNNGTKKGGNGGSGAVSFSVLVGEPRTQGRFGIAPIAAYAYLGKPVLPTVVTVTNQAGVVLREGIDYDLSFLDNDGAGLAHVIATGCTGTDYAGFSAVSSFEIYEPVYIDEYVCTRSTTPVRTNLNGHVIYLFRETASTDVQTLRDLTLRQYLVVGGGGRGGNTIGGGGGGGGVLKAKPKLRIDRGATMTVTVGAGGKDNLGGDTRYWTGLPGELSSVVGSGLNLIAYGGAGGAGYNKALPFGKYGSGGGSTAKRSAGSEGSQWTPGQGNGGGSSTDNIGGGGGGAFAAASGANGGEGVVSKITGEEVVYGSGGGGGAREAKYVPGTGGTNAGDGSATGVGGDGVDGTGAGGGGGVTNENGGNGGDGIVVLDFFPVQGGMLIVR